MPTSKNWGELIQFESFRKATFSKSRWRNINLRLKLNRNEKIQKNQWNKELVLKNLIDTSLALFTKE